MIENKNGFIRIPYGYRTLKIMEPLWMQILSMNMHSDEILDFQSNIGWHGNTKIISIHSIRNATHIQYRSRVTSDVQMQFSGFLLVDQKHHVKMTTWLFWKKYSRDWQKSGKYLVV